MKPYFYLSFVLSLLSLQTLIGQTSPENTSKINQSQAEQDKIISEWIPFRDGEKWHFVNQAGKTTLQITEPYDIVYPFDKGLALIRQDDCYGFIDETGAIVIPCELDKPHQVFYYWENPELLRIRRTDTLVAEMYGRNYKKEAWTWSRYNRKSKKYFDQFYAFNTRTYNGKRSGAYELGGKRSDNIQSLVAVKRAEKWGALNSNMEEVIPCVYDTIEFQQIGDMLVEKEKEFHLLTKVKREGKWGALNSNMKEVIPCVYDMVKFHKMGGILVKKGKKFHLLTDGGEKKLTFDSKKVQAFGRGYRVENKEGLVGYMTATGELTIPVIMDKLYFNERQIYLEKDQKYGRADLNGNIVIPCEYDEFFQSKYPQLSSKYQSTQFLRKGKEIYQVNFRIIPQLPIIISSKAPNEMAKISEPILTDFTEVHYLEDGSWLVSINEKKGIWNHNKFILSVEYDEIRPEFYLGRMTQQYAVKKGGQWGIVDYNQRLIFPHKADSIRFIEREWSSLSLKEFSFIRFKPKWYNFLSNERTVAFAMNNGRWGLANTSGDLYAKGIYDSIDVLFHDKLFRVEKDGKWGAIDDKGNVVVPIKEPLGFGIKGQEFRNFFLIKTVLQDGIECLYLRKEKLEKGKYPNVFQGPAGPAGPAGGGYKIDPAAEYILNSRDRYRYQLHLAEEIPQSIPCTSSAILDTIQKYASVQLGATGGDAAQGPAGPRGATGAAGAQGPAGPAGSTSPRGPGVNSKESLEQKKASFQKQGNYESVSNSGNNIWIVKTNGKWGLTKDNHEPILEAIYDTIYRSKSYQEPYFLVEKEKKFGWFSGTGETIIPMVYTELRMERQDYSKRAYTIISDKGIGLLTKDQLILPDYEEINSVLHIPRNLSSNALILVHKNGRYGFIGANGKAYFKD